MKKRLVAFLLLVCAMPALCCAPHRHPGSFLCGPVRIAPVAYPWTSFGSGWPSSRMCSPLRAEIRPTVMSVDMLTRTYAGVPFHRGAVFCRMENHFLRNYNFKLSIHAGGYRG